MDNNLVRLKLLQRLNKLASADYRNLECWQQAELLNKAQLQWTRRQLHGGNLYKEGDEQSLTRVDDFQFLLTPARLEGSSQELFFESVTLPDNYMRFKRVAVEAISEDCRNPKYITVTLVEEAHVSHLLADYLLRPSFKWAETFATLAGNHLRVYTGGTFSVTKCELIYYRLPRPIEFEGCRNWKDEAGMDVPFEFGDSVIDVIIDEAVSIAAADMQDFNNYQRANQEVETNN